MILANTISRGKGLRSIITKVVVQIGAKLGFVPWAMNNLPFSDEPTMIVGIDSYGKAGSSQQVYSFVTTIDESYAKYWSKCAFSKKDYPIEQFIKENLKKSVEFFHEKHGIYPFKLIVYREGVSRGERPKIKQKEVILIRQ